MAELIRERVLHHAKEEVPHAVAVAVEEFDESRRPASGAHPGGDLRGAGLPERPSSSANRAACSRPSAPRPGPEIEALLDAHVFLDLWVKVWKNWRKDPRALRTLGYQGISLPRLRGTSSLCSLACTSIILAASELIRLIDNFPKHAHNRTK